MVLCVFVAVSGPVVLGSIFPPIWWWNVRPPVPAHALHTYITYPSNENERITQLDTDEPPRTIQQFYRTALAPKGWQYRCTIRFAPSTGHDLELIDYYDRGAAGGSGRTAVACAMPPFTSSEDRFIDESEEYLVGIGSLLAPVHPTAARQTALDRPQCSLQQAGVSKDAR